MLSVCGKCVHCIADKEEPYLWVCALGYLALSEKIFGCKDLKLRKSKMIRVYCSHSIRGKMGKNATDEHMKANNDKAIEFGKKLRSAFPSINFYVPGDHDEFVLIAFLDKYINETQILAVDCKIVQRCNFLIAYSPDGFISGGMQVEIDYANKEGIPVLVIEGVGVTGLGAIHRHLEGMKS